MSIVFARHASSGFASWDESVVRWTLTESLKILVHAFVTSRVDYSNCNSVLASASKTITDELQRVMNAAARLISCTRKYDGGLFLHDELNWLDIPQRVQYKLAVTVHRCLRNQAPTYLTDYCVPRFQCPILSNAGRRHLRSASRHQLTVPHVRCSTFGWRSFVSAGPTVWNSLPDSLHIIQLLGQISFDGLWKPTCLPVVSVSLV